MNSEKPRKVNTTPETMQYWPFTDFAGAFEWAFSEDPYFDNFSNRKLFKIARNWKAKTSLSLSELVNNYLRDLNHMKQEDAVDLLWKRVQYNTGSYYIKKLRDGESLDTKLHLRGGFTKEQTKTLYKAKKGDWGSVRYLV